MWSYCTKNLSAAGAKAKSPQHPHWFSSADWHLLLFLLLLPLFLCFTKSCSVIRGEKGVWKVVWLRMIWAESTEIASLRLNLPSALLVWLPAPHIKLQCRPVPAQPWFPMLSKCYQHLGDLFNITLVKLLPLLEPRQHASLFFRESQEKLLKMCLKLHIPHSPWQRSFAKLVKRAGENSTAHFWVYGYYFACAAELIECDFGYPWSKGKWLPESGGCATERWRWLVFWLFTPICSTCRLLEKDESQGDEDKEERNKLGGFWNEPFFSLPPPLPFQMLDGLI